MAIYYTVVVNIFSREIRTSRLRLTFTAKRVAAIRIPFSILSTLPRGLNDRKTRRNISITHSIGRYIYIYIIATNGRAVFRYAFCQGV